MTRTLIAAGLALALVVFAGWSAVRLAEERRDAEAARLAGAQRAVVELERRRLADLRRGSLADAASAEEAARTLALLERLHAQERRLWNYYQVLCDSSQARHELIAARRAHEAQLRRSRRELAAIEATLDRLRPPAETGSIEFTER